jgi:hypothetical protein
MIGLMAVLIGFATTFIIPVSKGTFKAPFVIYLHGLFAFLWVILFVTQTFLIHYRNYRLHILLGTIGVAIAFGTSITMIPAGMYAVQKELNKGLGETAISGIVGTCTSSIMFLTLVLSGILYRKKSAIHKRLLLLATIVVLWPAWFRFRHYFPNVPRPDFWFGIFLADSLIILAWIWDRYSFGRIHPVLKYAGSFVIIENLIELTLFDSLIWRKAAHATYELLLKIY